VNKILEAHYRTNYDKLVKQFGSEDVVQEGYTRALELHDYFDWDEPEGFDRWLSVIMSKCSKEHWRDMNGLPPEEYNPDTVVYSTPEEEAAARQAVDLIQSKPLQVRWVLEMYFFKNMSKQAIVRQGPLSDRRVRDIIKDFSKEIGGE
jgi:DNA-directed RNA polymerase specialized sigma24 family protein